MAGDDPRPGPLPPPEGGSLRLPRAGEGARVTRHGDGEGARVARGGAGERARVLRDTEGTAASFSPLPLAGEGEGEGRPHRPPTLLTRTCARIARACLQLGVFGLVLLLAAVLWQVFGRYVLNDTPTWAESLALLLVLYVTMLGCAVGVRDAGHIGMELLGSLLPERFHVAIGIVVHGLTLMFGVVMAWNCALMFASVSGYRIPTLGISESWRYVPLVAAGALIVLFSVEHIVALLRGVEVERAWH